MSFLDKIFRKGRMGRTISRSETAERLNPILEQHVWLNHYYRHAVERLDNRRLAEHLAEETRTARNDVGKLNETILSAGHTPFSGTDIEPDEIDMSSGGGDYGLLYDLIDAEEDLQDAIEAEGDVEHQMRTRAILEVVQTNSKRRLSALKDATEGRRRPSESLHATRPSEKAEPTVADEPETEDEMKEERGEDELAKEMAARVEKS
ncbi:MAG: hypothetical protein BRD52_02580 [Bacteroidetes bacterium SW_4_67_19]|jgi:hypothetical protein|nr:MAG: hypothetical protein BRD52_02580 [Bacteroidetes bacterium SW_4_67_19]